MNEQNDSTESEAEFQANYIRIVGDATSRHHLEPEPRSSGSTYYARHVNVPSPPSWDVDASCRPKAVDDALNVLQYAVDRANEKATELQALPADEAAASAEFVREALLADKQDRRPKLSKTRDFAQERAVLEAQHAGRLREYQAARRNYDNAVQAARPEWLEALRARIPLMREQAQQAIGDLQRASARAYAYPQAVGAATLLWQDLNPAEPRPRAGKDAPTMAALQPAIDAAAVAVETTDEVQTGEFMQPDGLVPPRHVRRQMLDSGAGALMELARIEAEENWAHTDLTKPIASAYGYDRPKGWRRSKHGIGVFFE